MLLVEYNMYADSGIYTSPLDYCSIQCQLDQFTADEDIAHIKISINFLCGEKNGKFSDIGRTPVDNDSLLSVFLLPRLIAFLKVEVLAIK